MYTAECKECKRGNSVDSNRVVFCDGCSSPYHQLCHHPPIDNIYVEVPDAQWFCNECEAKRTDQPLDTGMASTELSAEVRRAYLSSLSKSQLVQLIQYAETLQPSLPLYSPKAYGLVKRMQQENADQPFRDKNTNANEELLVEVISEHPEGIEVADMWPAIDQKRKTPSDAAFKHSASRALQRARRRGRVTLSGSKYHINADYQPASNQALTQLLEADDDIMFAYMPLRMALENDNLPLEDSDVFSHKVYVQT